MNHKFFYLLLCLSLALSTTALTACGDEDETPTTNGNPSTPDTPTSTVNDPEGTILLNMQKGSYSNATTLYFDDYYIYIDEITNWKTHYACNICDVGAVNNIASITSIPEQGWTRSTAVQPKHGYIVRCERWNDGNISAYVYHRIYVTEWILSSGNSILGARVKYQLNWKRKDFENVENFEE